MGKAESRRRAAVRGRGPVSLLPCLILGLGLCAISAPPAPAQVVPTFTVDDCNQWNNPCSAWEECDEVFWGFFGTRVGPSGARIQYVLRIQNDGEVKSGLVLDDLLPACAQIDCSNLCLDTTCNDLPDTLPPLVTFSGGGFSDPPVCDEAGNRLSISGITLGPGELMDVRFCADFTAGGECCNDAVLQDPGEGLVQSATSAIDGREEACVSVSSGQVGGAWKDDCGPRTGHGEDCDDIGVNADGKRAVKPPLPSSGKRIRWILHLEGGSGEYRIEDEVPPDQTVICRAFQDPWGGNWGCFHMYRNGQEIDRGVDDACINGPGGGVNVIETLEAGDTFEVHFCARFNDDVGQLSCNRHAMYRSPPSASTRRTFVDHDNGERRTCILADGPRIRATKVVTVPRDGVARPGDRVRYRIELCETSGKGSVILHFQDWFPANIADPVMAPRTADLCRFLSGSMLCMFLELPPDGCNHPTIIEWEGTVTCDGLGDGDRICNQGDIEIRQPYDPLPMLTDDPADPTSDRDAACFRLALDGLDDSTKRVDLTTDVDGDTRADCEEDVLTYTIEVVSSGSAGALGVELTDDLPPEAVFVGGSLRLDGSPLPDPPGRTITLDLGDIPVGTSREITFQVRASDVGVGDYVLSNQAVLTSEDTRNCGRPVVTDDPTTRLGNDPAHREIVCSAPEFGDATKSVAAADGQSVREAWPGMDLVYTVDWCNTGTGPATGVAVRGRRLPGPGRLPRGGDSRPGGGRPGALPRGDGGGEPGDDLLRRGDQPGDRPRRPHAVHHRAPADGPAPQHGAGRPGGKLRARPAAPERDEGDRPGSRLSCLHRGGWDLGREAGPGLLRAGGRLRRRAAGEADRVRRPRRHHHRPGGGLPVGGPGTQGEWCDCTIDSRPSMGELGARQRISHRPRRREMGKVESRRRASVRGRSPAWLLPCLILGLGLCAIPAPPAPAQVVPTFTVDDCNQWNNPCSAWEECDEVIWFFTRSGPSGARIQYVLRVQNDGEVKSGLVLSDLLPACAQIDCSNLCLDTTCNDLPDTLPPLVTFSGGGFSDPPVCDEAGNRLSISGISLGPGELMDVRFCADFTVDGECCNDAILEDPGDGLVQSATCPILGADEACAHVGFSEGGAWIDDCGPRTGHTEDCDDIGTTADRRRTVKPPLPSAGKRVRWILHLEHRGVQAEYRIEDDVPLSQTVICRDFQDPWGENWGCFQMYRNGQEIDRGVDDACVNGPGGGIDVIETLEDGDVLEVHFCARINDDVGQMTCNRNAMYRTPPDAPFRMPFWDLLDGGRLHCILAEPPRVRATKVVTQPSGGMARPGQTVRYRIELCETSGEGDVEVHYRDPIPANIIDPVLGPDTQTICEILGDDISILCDFLTLPADGCRDPTVIEWEGTVTCDGLRDGDRICNLGEVDIRQPYDPMPMLTDDPADPTSDRDPACFRLALDGLGDSTKRVDLTTDVDGDTLADCGEDVLTYTIEVVSSGSADALQVELTDDLPPEAVFVGGSLRLDGSPLPDPPGRTITLDLGDIPVGTTREITFQVRAADVGVGDYVLSNQGVLTSEDTRNCGTPVVTDDPTTRLGNDPAHREIACMTPGFGDAWKSVVNLRGGRVTEAWREMDLVYTVDWCNTGTGPAAGVLFEDLLPVCVEYVGPTILDGVAVVPDPFDPAPPPAVRFMADGLQDPGECHAVEIPIRVVDDPVLCTEGTVVENLGTISCAEGLVRETNHGVPTRFTIVAPPTSLRRSTVLDDLVGGCVPDQPRLDETREIVPGPAFPVCIEGDGMPGSGRVLVFYELAGDCDGVLRMRRTECSDPGDTVIDLEAAYL